MKKTHYLNDFDFVSRLPAKEFDVKVNKKNRSVDFVAPYANAKIYCHATFKTSGKLDSVEVELKDVYEKYGTKENIGDWVVGVKDKVSFTWVDKGRICFAFAPKDEVIVFENLPSDCLSLVDLFVEQMNDYTKMSVSDPFKVDFQFTHALKGLKNDKISSLVFSIILAALSIFSFVLIFVQVANDSIAGTVVFVLLTIVALVLFIKFFSSFMTNKKDFDKVNLQKINHGKKK